MWPDVPPTVTVEAPPAAYVRVDDPAWPGAVARSDAHALLAAPPPAGTRWTWETVAVPDGWSGDATPSVMNADDWHDAGFRGQGVRVAVFDLQWYGAGLDTGQLGADVVSADCWTHPSCEVAMDPTVARFGYEAGVHGYACADVVRDVAPDAELFLVRVTGFTTFSNAVAWAIRHDIDVISISMSFFNESFYDGSGPFDAPLRALAAHDILLVASAGNYQRQHWSGAWTDGDGDARLDFGGTNQLALSLSAGRRSAYVNWDEHWSCGGSDLDVRIVGADGTIYGRSEDAQLPSADRCDPVERISAEIPADGTYYMEVRANRLQRTGLEVDINLTSGSVIDGVPENSLTDPGSSPWVFTVGAVRASGYLGNDIEGFSSLGPGRSGVLKPDVAGPDGLSTAAYGGGSFFGTSASTPAVAGAVALVLSRYPDLTPQEAAEQLRAWAWADDDVAHDVRWGAGKVRLPDPEADAPRRCATSPGGTVAVAWAVVVGLAVRRRRAG